MTDALSHFCILDEREQLRRCNVAHPALAYDHWTVLDTNQKRQKFYEAFPSSLTVWSALDPELEVREMNAALA